MELIWKGSESEVWEAAKGFFQVPAGELPEDWVDQVELFTSPWEAVLAYELPRTVAEWCRDHWEGASYVVRTYEDSYGDMMETFAAVVYTGSYIESGGKKYLIPSKLNLSEDGQIFVDGELKEIPLTVANKARLISLKRELIGRGFNVWNTNMGGLTVY